MAELAATDYLERILTARTGDLAIETSLDPAPRLSERLGNTVLLKREDQQPAFSFKLRGAFNKMVNLAPDALARGVVCASAGNHAQGVALSALHLGTRAVVVMPVTTPAVKIDAVRALGAEVHLFGESYSDADEQARTLQTQRGLTFVHPFDDPDVIAGQGTIALEMLRQHEGPIHAIFVPVGGGGLVAGVAAYVKAVRPEIKVIGVQMSDSDAMARSVEAGHRVELERVGLFSDGTAVRLVGEETFRLVTDLVDDLIRVDTDAVCAAIKDVFLDTRSIVEPAGALGVAGLKSHVEQFGTAGETYVAITSGANLNFDRLRFVADRAEVGEHREALFAVTIPEELGSFRRFAELVGSLPRGPHDVTEFNYRISGATDAHVFVGLTVTGRAEAVSIAAAFRGAGFEALDLTDDELAKEHLRHLVGGRDPFAEGERLLRFDFPERPGALLRFLGLMAPTWNISLFHYRNQGGDSGRVLVGLQVPPSDHLLFDDFLASLGFPFVDESANPAYALFLRA